MYRSQSSMGEYFAAQSGMGEYLQASAGMGEYFGANGISGLGEYFGANGLGEMAPLTDDEKKKVAMYAGGGLVAGLLGAVLMRKTKTSGLVVGGGLGAVVALIAFYAMRPAAA